MHTTLSRHETLLSHNIGISQDVNLFVMNTDMHCNYVLNIIIFSKMLYTCRSANRIAPINLYNIPNIVDECFLLISITAIRSNYVWKTHANSQIDLFT